MRQFRHMLCQSRSGKSVMLRVDIDDRFGKQAVNIASVSGWRGRLALNHLSFEGNDWNDDAARKYVCIRVLKCAKNKFDAINFINTVKSLSSIEIHFWANKFMINENAGKAWRAMYL
jgi:hypothetical protein